MRPLVLLWGCLLLPGSEALKGPKEVSGFEGDTLSLKCTYGEESREHTKYWCQEAGTLLSRCSGTLSSGRAGQENRKGRVSIRDNPQELSFTVTLRTLTLKDTGKYWCGVSKLGLDETFLVSLIVFPGSSRPATHLDPTSAEDTSPAPSSRSSEPGVSIPRTRLLAPVLVLVALLLATGLIALGDHMLRWRKKVPLAMETQKNEKVYLPITPLGNDCVPAETLMNLPGPTGPLASPQPSAGAYREIQCLRQTTEEPEAPSQGPKEHQTPCPAPPLSEEELRFSEFIPV